MKKIIPAILFIMILATGCQKPKVFSLKDYDSNKAIALQSMGNFSKSQLEVIGNRISFFFHRRVVILNSIDIPAGYHPVNEDKYSADSLLQFLSTITNDTIEEVIGLTDKDMYVTKVHKAGKNDFAFERRYIFGLGSLPGNSCIISGYRLRSKDENIFMDRLQKVIIHEVGHNMGLSHCPVNTCIMFEGEVPQLDKWNGDFCSKCRQLLIR